MVNQDVIGAAETGSGKTLAFGLPILQRLLEEREKEGRFLYDSNNSTKKVFHKGPLRALIITPTRELALQVRSKFDLFCIGNSKIGNFLFAKIEATEISFISYIYCVCVCVCVVFWSIY